MEILFNLHRNDIFAVSRQESLSFYCLDSSDFDESEEIATSLFLSKDADFNTDIRCMSWHPSAEHDHIIALGQSNGRVVLKSAGFDGCSSSSQFAGKEYIPKHTRPCNALAWNKFSSNWLAVGLEKHKTASLIIWDVNSKSDISQTISDRVKLSGTDLSPSPNNLYALSKPLVEIAPGDTVNSLAWLGQGGDTHTLLAGFNRKALRIYDIRTTMNLVGNSVINHKATFGICVDPMMEHRIASFCDTGITVWDSRSLNKPAVTIPLNHNISKIEWSPTREGMLAALLTCPQDGNGAIPDNEVVFVYDLMKSTYADQDLEVASYVPITRMVKPKLTKGEWINGFAWLPASTSPTLLTTSNVSLFFTTKVLERTVVSWGANRSIAMARGPNTYFYTHDANLPICMTTDTSEHADEFVDIEKIIADRAKNGYGYLTENHSKNIELCLEPKNRSLHLMWEWIERIQQLAPSANPTTPSQNTSQSPISWNTQNRSRNTSRRLSLKLGKPTTYFKGIQSVLRGSDASGEPNSNQSLVETIQWIGIPATKSTVYSSKRRNIALALCGWGDQSSLSSGGKLVEERFGRNSIGENLVRQLHVAGETERACAVAVWHLDMKLAIEILNVSSTKQDNSDFSAFAMALSGYSGVNSPTLWLDTCRRVQGELKSVYLQMAFVFLIASAEDSKSIDNTGKYEAILNNKSILLQDRVAFACIYLSDYVLSSYLELLSENVVEQALLAGTLVTGLATSEGVQLLQNYIDKTGDVQTALVAIMLTHNPPMMMHPNVIHWKESYCHFLNKRKLCVERVEFDLHWARSSSVQKSSSQVYVHCNYCNKSISNSSQVARGDDASGMSPVPRYRVCSGSGRETCCHRSFRRPNVLESDRKRHFSDPVRPLVAAVTSPGGRGRGFMGGGSAMQSSVSSCPSCKKPLPRCSVCSLHVGTRNNETDVSLWLSWCVKCRHGGHQGHLMEWFKDHIQCPVADCKCCCDSDLPTT